MTFFACYDMPDGGLHVTMCQVAWPTSVLSNLQCFVVCTWHANITSMRSCA